MGDIESIVPGSWAYETWNPATAMPVTGLGMAVTLAMGDRVKAPKSMYAR